MERLPAVCAGRLGAIAAFMQASGQPVTVVGALEVAHGSIPLLGSFLAAVGLVPPASQQSRVAVVNTRGHWLRSFDGQFVSSQWPEPAEKDGSGQLCTDPRAERFGGLELIQEAHVHTVDDRPRVTLTHVGTRVLRYLPLPTWLVGVHSNMLLHADGMGWDLEVGSTVLGHLLVSYAGPMRLVQTEHEASEARQLLHHIVLFDGVCNLCNRSIDFILRHDTRQPPAFLVASAQSEVGAEALRCRGATELVGDLGSVLLLPAGGGPPLKQADAVLGIGIGLGGPWRVLALVTKLVPRVFLHRAYDWVSNNRYSWFGKKTTCRVPTKDERARFLS